MAQGGQGAKRQAEKLRGGVVFCAGLGYEVEAEKEHHLSVKDQIKKLDREAVRLARETFATSVTPDRLLQIETRLLQIESEQKTLYA